ncbi:hypothetical protein M432DRAFT_27627 [Thermoascus aurantiacus ATCC 26904]
MLFLLILSPFPLLCQLAYGLPPPATYADGKFLYPNGHPEIFDEGTPMNISWQTVYNNSNLYLIYGSEFNNPQGIVINTAATWYEWQISIPPRFANRSIPFVFRIVNAQGTTQDQLAGGFLSAGFYVPAKDQPSVSTSSTRSSTSSRSRTTTRITISSALSTISKPTTAAATTSSPPAAAATSTVATEAGGITNETRLRVGLGVGLGVPLFLALAAILYFLRRSRSKKAAAAAETCPPPSSTAAFVDKDSQLDSAEPRRTYFGGELEGDDCLHEFPTGRDSQPRYELG